MARRITKVVGIVVLGGVILYGILGFFVLPPLVRGKLIDQLSEKLGRTVTIQRVQINPFFLTCQISGLAIANRAESTPLFSLDELFIDAEIASVLARGPVIKQLRLHAPQAHLIRYADRTYNVSDMIDKVMSPAGPSDTAERGEATSTSPPSKPFVFSVSNIEISAGSVTFTDQPEEAEHHVTELYLGVPFISNLPEYVDAYVQPLFHASVNGTPVTFAGNTQPFSTSRTAGLGLAIHQFDLPQYLAYVPAYRPEEVGFQLASGLLDAELSVIFTQGSKQPAAVRLSGHVRLQELTVNDVEKRPLLALPELEVGMESADLFDKRVHLSRVRIQAPTIHLTRSKSGTVGPFGLSHAAQRKPLSSEAAPQAAGKPFDVTVDEVTLDNGTVRLLDQQVTPPFQTTLSSITAAVRNFSTKPGQAALVEASLKSDGGERVRQTGRLTLEPLAAEGSLELQRIALNRYGAYYRPSVDVAADGRVDISADYRYATGEGGTIKISRLEGRLTGLKLQQPNESEPFLQIPVLALTGGEVDLGRHTVKVAGLRSDNGAVRVTRRRDGVLNVASLRLVTAPPSAASSPAPPAAASPPWRVAVRNLALGRYRVTIEDELPPEPVTVVVSPLTITMKNLSTSEGARATASLQAMTDTGSVVDLHGSIGLQPLAANLEVQVDGVQLAPLQPYWADRANVEVASGAVSAKGTLTIDTGPGPDHQITTTFSGATALTNLAALDKATQQALLKWSGLHADGVRASTRPAALRIEEVALTDFYSHIVVTPDGTVNVLEALRAKDHDGSPSPAADEPDNHAAPTADTVKETPQLWQAQIQTVTLQDGRIDFADQFIKPNYAASLTELAGRISNLSSSDEAQPADVNLRGKLNENSTLEVTGQMRPLSTNLSMDVKLETRDVELNALTTYAAKYVGYTIEKGQLSMSLRYQIADRKLQAHNNIVLNQFTLGQKVDSPDATNLPLRAAVSLLKDRHGQIKLDIPVTGALDDPEFSIWRIIGQVTKNLITKAATAPFALIGAMFGGNEEVRHAEFDYGKADTSASSETKLKALAKVLYERPGLKIEIVPHVDPAKDREALRQQRFQEKLRAQKWKDLSKQGEVNLSLGSPDTMTINPNEYATYLEKAYRAETFSKPRNMFGMTKRLEVREMEKLMLTHIEVTEDDLRQLAMRRAQQVKDFLVRSQVEPDRLFLVDSRGAKNETEPKESVKLSRVDFVLQP